MRNRTSRSNPIIALAAALTVAGILSTTPAFAWKAHSGSEAGLGIVGAGNGQSGLARSDGVEVLAARANPKPGSKKECTPADARTEKVECEDPGRKDRRGGPCYRDNSGRPVLSGRASGESAAPAGADDAATPSRRGRGGEHVCDERVPGSSGERVPGSSGEL
ncbi:MAG: hypothetical protein KatS3mg119_1594 [Rhodothalassiaceae bacterium]|nr:MAG: hypothetical protein KatS3mg119_1594 [Rhodothalassiaceae bacterium]